MISNITFAFLKAVKENNNLDRMNKNRDLYHMVRDQFRDFAAKLIEKMRSFDKSIENLTVKDATFRFNKDIRFTKDKSPYKTNLGIIIRDEGKHGDGAGYYLHIEPGESFLFGGIYNPKGMVAQRIRSYIAAHYRQLEKILNEADFKKTFGSLDGERLQNVPRGFAKDHKAGKYLKMKSRYIETAIPDERAMQDDFIEYCVDLGRKMKPLIDFLNKAYNA